VLAARTSRADSVAVMLTDPPHVAIYKAALPTVLSFLAQALYSIADALFVAHTGGTVALSAMSVAMPVEMSFLAIGQCVAGGTSVLVTRALGRFDVASARRALGTALVLDLLLVLLIPMVVSPFLDSTILPFLGAQTTTVEMASDYAHIATACAYSQIFFVLINYTARAQGFYARSLVFNVSASVLNLIGDAILVGALGWGPRGAAISTVVSLTSVTTLAVLFEVYLAARRAWRSNAAKAPPPATLPSPNRTRQRSTSTQIPLSGRPSASPFSGRRLSFTQMGVMGSLMSPSRVRAPGLAPKLCFHPRIVSRIFTLGISSTIVSLTTTATSVALNYSLRSHLTDVTEIVAAVAAYGGIISRFQSFCLMLLNGLGSSIGPIISANHSAMLRYRCDAILALGQRATIALAAFLQVLAFALAPFVEAMFDVSSAAALIARRGIFLSFSLFLLEPAITVFSVSFRALGRPAESLLIVAAKGLLQVVGVLILPAIAGLLDSGWASDPTTLVWFAWPIAQAISCLVARYMVRARIGRTGISAEKVLFTENWKTSTRQIVQSASNLLSCKPAAGSAPTYLSYAESPRPMTGASIHSALSDGRSRSDSISSARFCPTGPGSHHVRPSCAAFTNDASLDDDNSHHEDSLPPFSSFTPPDHMSPTSSRSAYSASPWDLIPDLPQASAISPALSGSRPGSAQSVSATILDAIQEISADSSLTEFGRPFRDLGLREPPSCSS
jgi:Na+-driven multidrug efflux pump